MYYYNSELLKTQHILEQRGCTDGTLPMIVLNINATTPRPAGRRALQLDLQKMHARTQADRWVDAPAGGHRSTANQQSTGPAPLTLPAQLLLPSLNLAASSMEAFTYCRARGFHLLASACSWGHARGAGPGAGQGLDRRLAIIRAPGAAATYA